MSDGPLTSDYPGFSNPFDLPSSRFFPSNFEGAFDFMLHLFCANPALVEASRRVFASHITPPKFSGKRGDETERSRVTSYLVDHLRINRAFRMMGMEWTCYGNSLWWIYFPFRRFLVDARNPSHPREWAVDMFPEAQTSYNYADMTYTVPDPVNENGLKGTVNPDAPRVKFTFLDRRSNDLTRVSLRRLDPRFVTMQHNDISGTTRYIWRVSEEFVANHIKAGRIPIVNEVPIDILRAVSQNADFKFDDGKVFHYKEDPPTGLHNSGWGLPPTMMIYGSLHKLQVIRKVDEVWGKDRILPMRLFTPDLKGVPSSDGTGALGIAHLGIWRKAMGEFISKFRKAPFAVHALPFATTYQQTAASQEGMVAKDLVEHYTNSSLDESGFPASIYHGNLATDNIPLMLRMFQTRHMGIFEALSAFIKWVNASVFSYFNQQVLSVSLEPPDVMDDELRRHVLMNLTAGGEMPRSQGLKWLGVGSPVSLARERAEEDAEITRVQAVAQQKLQTQLNNGSVSDEVAGGQEGAAGAAPAGGGGGGSSGVTPTDQADKITAKAEEWLKIADNGERAKAMAATKASDFELYSAAKQRMEEIRMKGASQGRKSVANPQG